MDREHRYSSGDEFLEALLTALWGSGFEGKAACIPCQADYDFSQADAVAEIMAAIGQAEAIKVNRTDRSITVEARMIEPETYTISVPQILDAGRLILALVVLATRSTGRVRFIVRGELLSVGKTPIYFLTDTIFKGLGDFAEIRTNFDKLKYHAGCEVSVIVSPKSFLLKKVEKIVILPAVPKEVRGTSSSAQSLEEREVAERQSVGARQELGPLPCPIKIRKIYEPKSQPGTVCSLSAHLKEGTFEFYLGAWSYGERSKPAEIVGQEAADLLFSQIESCTPAPHLMYFYAPILYLKGVSLSPKEELDDQAMYHVLAEDFGSKVLSEVGCGLN
jgi:RNA 3'-terminal phosphate cyclase